MDSQKQVAPLNLDAVRARLEEYKRVMYTFYDYHYPNMDEYISPADVRALVAEVEALRATLLECLPLAEQAKQNQDASVAEIERLRQQNDLFREALIEEGVNVVVLERLV